MSSKQIPEFLQKSLKISFYIYFFKEHENILTVFELSILLRQEPSGTESGCHAVSDVVLHKIREATV